MRRVSLWVALGVSAALFFSVADSSPGVILPPESGEPARPSTTSTTSTTSSTSSTSSTTTSSTSSTTSSTTSTTAIEAPVEICGDCIDNDGNGLTDFEDGACCGRSVTMTVRKARLAPAGSGALLSLKATLAAAGFAGTVEDAFLQLGREGEPDLLCARLPAADLVAKRTSVGFLDKRHAVASARGLEKLVLSAKKGGSLSLVASGRQVAASVPSAGAIRITLGLQAAAGDERGNACAGAVTSFRAAAKGALRAP